MICKDAYINILSHTVDILTTHGLERSIEAEVDEVRKAIRSYQFRVIMVGSFSSGKSALINRFIDRPLLTESQLPETAVPTEIVWSRDEHAKIFYRNGASEVLSIEEATKRNPSDIALIILYIDSKELKDRPDLVLVDFPGLGSNSRAHNEAIASYISEGSAFILTISVDSGTLNESVCTFIREISDYPQSLACFVTKSDLKPAGQVEDVVAQVKETIESLYLAKVPVTSVSKFAEADPETPRKFGYALNAFEPQKLFEHKLGVRVNSTLIKGEEALAAAISAVSLDLEDIEERISKCERAKRDLQGTLEDESLRLSSKYRNTIIPNIMNKVKNALASNSERLTHSMLVSEQSFADTVSSILRPIMHDMPADVKAEVDGLIGGLVFPTIDGDLSFDTDRLKEILKDVISIIGATGGTSTYKSGRGRPKKDPAGGRTSNVPLVQGIGSLGTGVAVATGALAPWAGVALIAVPFVIDLIGDFAKKSAERKQLEEARNYVQAQAIPSIISKVEGDVARAVMETHDAMLAELTKQIEASIEAQEIALAEAKKEYASRTSQHDEMVKKLTNDLETIRSLMIKEV